MKKTSVIFFFILLIFFGSITNISSGPTNFELKKELRKPHQDRSSLAYAFDKINSRVQEKVDKEDSGWWVISVTD